MQPDAERRQDDNRCGGETAAPDGRLRRSGRGSGQRQGTAEEIDPPALGLRIEAIHELAEAGADEDPAGAAGSAVVAAGAGPGGVEQSPSQERDEDAPAAVRR